MLLTTSVEFGAGLKSNNLWKMDRCLLFSFVYLVTDVILALSIKCRKKANQIAGILPSLVDVEYTVKKNPFSQGFSS